MVTTVEESGQTEESEATDRGEKAGVKATNLGLVGKGPEPLILGGTSDSASPHTVTGVSFADVVKTRGTNRIVPRVIGKSEGRVNSLSSLFKKNPIVRAK